MGRIIALNNHIANADFPSSSRSMGKYNPITFVPKFLTGPFVVSINLLPVNKLCRAIFKICKIFFLFIVWI
jgi:hypothetical protein